MVCYFILRHIFMIGSHRPVRRQGRKPGASSPTRWKLGRGGGRRQISSCQVQAVLPVGGTGTTGQRYYRPVLKPAPSPLDAPVLACGTTARKRYYRSPKRYYW